MIPRDLHPLPPMGKPTEPFGESEPQPNVIINRELWLTAALACLAEGVFRPAGYDVPENVRVSCSWPSHGGLAPKHRVLGQAWDSSCSRDGYFEIFVSPYMDDPEQVLEVEAHELTHVVVGIEHGHLKPFRDCALAIGFEGKMTATRAGAAFKRAVAPILENLGPYPHGALDPNRALPSDPDGNPNTTGKKRQKSRMRKAECEECGLTLRLAAKWIIGKELSCPDMNCGGHEYPLQIS